MLRYEWKHAVVKTEVAPFEGGESLADDQRAQIAASIFGSARTPPVAFSLGRGDAAGTVTTEIALLIGSWSLRPDVRAVVALWGYPDSQKRLIYGDLLEGRYAFKWDSPVLFGHSPTLEFADVDGDGVKEIAIHSMFERQETLTIFNQYGEEVSRQPDCDWIRPEEGLVCPIMGDELRVEDGVGGRKEIFIEDRWGSHRLVLVGGRYVRSPKDQ